MKFWDTSAIAPLLVRDAFTPRVVALLQADPDVVAWWGTPIECVSALARREREGMIGRQAVASALARLRTLQAAWNEIQPSEMVRETAQRLLRLHPLRAADSLQLAAALVAADHRPSQLLFVCNDDRLSDAAQREGFTVVSE